MKNVNNSKDSSLSVIPEAGVYDLDRENKPNKYLMVEYGWHPIPDCRDFKLSPWKWNEFLKAYGIKKKDRNPPTIIPYVNRSMNRYMEHSIILLDHYKYRHPERYFKYVWFLMRRSQSFLVAKLNMTLSNWDKAHWAKHILAALKRTKKLAADRDASLKYKRTYIPKGNGKVRPLGVPSMPWRLLMSMYNNFLYQFIDDYMPREQHGFIPGRGCLTAWYDVWSKAVHAKNIYEFDLKSFFDKVDLNFISHRLRQFKVPESEIVWLENVNTSAIKLPPKHQQDESQQIIRNELEFIGATGIVQDGMWRQELMRMREDGPLIDQIIMEDLQLSRKPTIYDDFEYIQLQWAIMSSVTGREHFYEKYKGVPQGLPTSPLLASLALIDTVIVPGKTIQYADDGIWYDVDGPQVKQNWESAGIELNTDKSGWVKKDGRWLKPLKFLGMQFDGSKWRAASRKGSTLEMKIRTLKKLKDVKEIPYLNKKKTALKIIKSIPKWTWDIFAKTNYAGLIQSRMYAGSWHVKPYSQKVSLEYHRGSYLATCKRPINVFINLYNSRSIASQSLVQHLKSLKFTIKSLPREPNQPKFTGIRKLRSFNNSRWGGHLMIGLKDKPMKTSQRRVKSNEAGD